MREEFAVVLLDVSMPEWTVRGARLLRGIALRRRPTYLVSGRAGPDWTTQGYKVGEVDYVPIPVCRRSWQQVRKSWSSCTAKRRELRS